ncbi:WD-REPEATS-REGION domain-containing protein [Mycena chlorophos]|uniref:WD-REPEATS-REGION domain-containing protein n=1 Tax=Mycena chlorophos TaxID=658473 RepID=A0A8H6SDA6_MYCCL|nr:WD-REPEATS-REGION domain-containing protein [Mycena chlorophos]
MDSLLAKADARAKRRKITHDRTEDSLKHHSSVPKSLRDKKTAQTQDVFKHIANPKLRRQLDNTEAQAARAKALLEDAEMLLVEDTGLMQAEGDLERTWRVSQSEIERSAGHAAAQGRRECKLDGGPYRSRYTRNGRHLAIVGNSGHAATFDWITGTLHTELQLQETCRAVTSLGFAVAQKKYIYIYDQDGVELHCLKAHIEPTRLEFLPYHWLLASITHRTKLGANAMTQNLYNAVIHLGHQNGCVTLWTPNLPHPAVQLLAHLGPVCSVAVDPSTGGRYMATAGRDSTVKVWDCRNWKGAVREWSSRGGPAELDWSSRGALAVASGGHVNVYTSSIIQQTMRGSTQPPLYLTHPMPHRPLVFAQFAPFQDILTVGHADGLSSILVPGVGEPNFDSTEADPFENHKARREKEVKALLDKIQPDMITLDPEFMGSLAPKQSTATTLDGKQVPPETAWRFRARTLPNALGRPRYEISWVDFVVQNSSLWESDVGRARDAICTLAREIRKLFAVGKVYDVMCPRLGSPTPTMELDPLDLYADGVYCDCDLYCKPGDGPISRSSRDNHRRDAALVLGFRVSTGERRKLKAQATAAHPDAPDVDMDAPPPIPPTSGNANLHDYADIQAELAARKGRFITQFSTPLRFYEDPEQTAYTLLAEWVVCEPNQGPHRLRETHRNNTRLLENEARMHELHLMLAGWPEDSRKRPTLDIIAREMLATDEEKERHWDHQRLQKRMKDVHVVLNDAPFAHRPSNPTVLAALITSAISSHIYHLPQLGGNINLAGLRDVLSHDPNYKNFLRDIPRDVRTVANVLNLNPATTAYVACPKEQCRALVLESSLSKDMRDRVISTCKATIFGQPCGTALTGWVFRPDGQEDLVRPLQSVLLQDFKDWLGRLLARPGMEDLLSDYPPLNSP